MAVHLDDIPLGLRSCERLTEDDLWLDAGPTVWRARRFVGEPRFNPVYQRGDYYSFSPIFLLAHKRSVDLDRGFMRKIAARERSGVAYYSGRSTIDREIRRIGGPTAFDRTIFSAAQYATKLAEAMITDIERVDVP